LQDIPILNGEPLQLHYVNHSLEFAPVFVHKARDQLLKLLLTGTQVAIQVGSFEFGQVLLTDITPDGKHERHRAVQRELRDDAAPKHPLPARRRQPELGRLFPTGLPCPPQRELPYTRQRLGNAKFKDGFADECVCWHPKDPLQWPG
jgi:hypothetical protein